MVCDYMHLSRTLLIELRMYEDLYGKGYSEAPTLPYDANLFTIQLALLMQYVRWDAATIVGFSMVSTLSLKVRVFRVISRAQTWSSLGWRCDRGIRLVISSSLR